MRAILKFLTVTAPLFLLSACTSYQINSDFDRGTDFSGYQTFSYLSDKPLLVADIAGTSPLLQSRLITATTRELTAKGLRFTQNRENADFVISFTLGARDKIKVTNYPSQYRGAYYGGYGGWGASYYNEVDVRNYTEGTLAIDVFDVASRTPVWHGWAVKSITTADRSNPEPLINEIVAAILADFPPQSGG